MLSLLSVRICCRKKLHGLSVGTLDMLDKRIRDLGVALHRLELRLDQLELDQSHLLDFNKRCKGLFARQNATLQRLAALDGQPHELLLALKRVPSYSQHSAVSRSDTETGSDACALNTQNVANEQPEAVTNTEARLSQELDLLAIRSYNFARVPSNYYDQELEFRRNCLQAASTAHMCKSLIVENTHMPEDQCGNNPENSRHYLILVQYAARFHGEKLKRYLHKLNGKLGIQYFRLTFATPEVSEQLSGYAHGSVTPVGLRTRVPIILSHKITQLSPSFFWMGGGEQDLKLGITVEDFLQGYEPSVVDCTY